MNFINKNLCNGCHACYNICLQNSIIMKAENGFLFPFIEQTKCVDCRMCEKICPVLSPKKKESNVKSFACVNNEESIRKDSSSGGIFSLIAQETINNNGVVFGAAFDDKLEVVHTVIEKNDEIYKLRGSKYVQSRIGTAYKCAKQYLDDDRLVLFTGTPCQIGGLKSYLKKDYDKLITQDIICHGVPSPEVWKKYCKYLENKYNSKISREPFPSFRLKDGSWKRYSVSIKFENDIEYRNTVDKDLYMKAFLANLSLRASCYNCHFKGLNRNSDITLADFWGVENIVPEFFDDKGTSLVLINTKKGRMLFDNIKMKLKHKEVDIEQAISYNSAAVKSAPLNVHREQFLDELTADSFEKTVKKYTKQKFTQRIINKIINN